MAIDNVLRMLLLCGLIVFCFGFLPGCALLESSGQAKYSLEPIIIQDGADKEKAVCCQVIIHNSKNIGAVKTEAEYDPQTGKFKVKLHEEGVDSQGPASAAASAQTEVIKALVPLVK